MWYRLCGPGHTAGRRSFALTLVEPVRLSSNRDRNGIADQVLIEERHAVGVPSYVGVAARPSVQSALHRRQCRPGHGVVVHHGRRFQALQENPAFPRSGLMPVSAALSCAFIHVRKTAGTSMARILSDADPRLYLNDVGLWSVLCAHPERRRLLLKLRSFYPIGSVSTYPQWHLPAVIVRELVGERRWSSLFSFAFVRNPWDLVVSAYHFERRHLSEEYRQQMEPDRTEAMRRCPDFDRFVRIYPLLEPMDQTSMIADDEGNIIVI